LVQISEPGHDPPKCL
jgi:hypothetical protein